MDVKEVVKQNGKKAGGFLAEFREFLQRGSVMDMAVGIIIGAAFKAIVDSLVNDILMPFIGIFVGKDSFTSLSAQVGGAVINYGKFISAIINFLILALVLFLMIKAMNRFQEQLKETGTQPVSQVGTPMEQIRQAVRDGAKDSIAGLIDQALTAGIDPLVITQDGLTAAMTAVGDDYGRGRCYLPQVMLAAETMQAAFTALKKALPPDFSFARKGPFVIATVKGDIHDLGKNIVAALMENSGYEVIDLGKNADAETIADAVCTSGAPLLGLSALMTTTMPQIDVTIDVIRKQGINVRIIAGGAVLTQEYAEKAGADAYARDAAAAVKWANKLTGAEQ